jgi:hypothetical protein
MVRTHRGFVQKPLYWAVFRCDKCDYREKLVRPALRVKIGFIFSLHTHCIRCGTGHVHRLPKRDRIDSMSNHFASWLLRLTGAPLNKCPACRLQYYDWRTPLNDDAGEQAATGQTSTRRVP